MGLFTFTFENTCARLALYLSWEGHVPNGEQQRSAFFLGTRTIPAHKSLGTLTQMMTPVTFIFARYSFTLFLEWEGVISFNWVVFGLHGILRPGNHVGNVQFLSIVINKIDLRK